jgi:hypothetical protein
MPSKSKTKVVLSGSTLKKNEPTYTINTGVGVVESTSLEKNLRSFVDTNDKVYRKAFEVNPQIINQFGSVYQPKQYLIPDLLLKRISLQDSLISAILLNRGTQISQFGRPLIDRYKNGYKIQIKPQFLRSLDSDKKEQLMGKIDKATKNLFTCGETDRLPTHKFMNFSEYLRLIVQDGLLFGRFSTEIIWKTNPYGERAFAYFRPVDAGTIYFASQHSESEAHTIRKNAEVELAEINKTATRPILPERLFNNEYSYIQVINAKPEQAFSAEELIVQNLYPSTNVDLIGYPATPIDKVISDVLTHINITTYNKMYFQSGRATKGMLVIKSAQVDDEELEDLRQHFNASINNAANAWRMPVFQIGPDDDIKWETLDGGGAKDMEFQYLFDTNIRVIMSAFQISPEEIAGYAYLSRGTLSQSLSESNNAYQLEAARDSGIRPLLSILQDFINLHLFPIVAPELAEMCYVELCGLDKDSPDKESSLLTTEASLHMTVNELLMAVEKPIIPKFLGGDYPLNPAIQQILKENVPFGVILENFLGIKGASQDPKYQFIQNNFYFQYLQYMNQMETQMQQMQMQQQQAQQEQQAQAQQPPPGQDAQQAPAGQPAPQGAPQEPVMISPQDISFQDIPSGIKSVQQSLGKSEPAAILTKQQNLIVSNVMDSWAKEAEEELKRILESLDKNGN